MSATRSRIPRNPRRPRRGQLAALPTLADVREVQKIARSAAGYEMPPLCEATTPTPRARCRARLPARRPRHRQTVAGKYEFTYRDATGRQVWQTTKGETKADARAERA